MMNIGNYKEYLNFKKEQSMNNIENKINNWQKSKGLNLTFSIVKQIANNINKNKCQTNN